MRKRTGISLMSILTLTAICLVMLACSGGKPAATPNDGEPTAIKENQGVPGTQTGIETKASGLNQNPSLPYELDTTLTYQTYSGDKMVGESNVSFSQVGDGGFRGDCEFAPLSEEGDYAIAHIKSVLAMDVRLRPKQYIQRILGADETPRSTRSVDFTGEKIIVDNKLDPMQPQDDVTELVRPFGDVWPFDLESIMSLMVIAACVDPTGPGAEMNVFLIGEDRMADITFVPLGENPLVLKNQSTTIMTQAFRFDIEGAPIGQVNITPDGRLISKVDAATNTYTELLTPTDVVTQVE